MVAVVAEPERAAPGRAATLWHLSCPDCARLIGKTALYAIVPRGTVCTIHYCRTCGRWRKFDATDGRYMGDLTESPPS
jgi:hypothetical protein